jgi:GT2 family glycosyltransferase
MPNYPLVSILWLNYNSFPFINIVLESLQGIQNLDYPNYELIIVDNGSTDGSLKIIKNAIAKMKINSKIIELKMNLGFTGGNNVAYRAMDQNSKYVVLLNNDAVPYSESLRNLVEVMENDKTLGSAQGVILNYDEKTIDTAGGFESELLTSYLFLQGSEPKALKREMYVSHTNGAYAIYRVESIKKAMKDNRRIFDNELFSLREDDLIGFKLWNAGFKVKSLPVISAKHMRGSSFKRIGDRGVYLRIRNWLLLNEILNSRYKKLIRFLIFRYWLTLPISVLTHRRERACKDVSLSIHMKTVQKAIIDGVKIGKKKKSKGVINMYKAPVIKVSPYVAALGLTVPLSIVDNEIRKSLHTIL